MARPRRALAAPLLLPLLLLAPAAAGVVAPGVPQEGPDVPTVTEPTAVVTVLEDEHWHNAGGLRSRLVDVPESPTGRWDRIVLDYRQYNHPDPARQDPWDRLCSAYVGGVEVLRCTTPRTDMTLRKDLTEVAALLEPGTTVRAGASTGSYDQPQYYRGGQYVTMRLEFYADEPTAPLVADPADVVVPVFYQRGVCANGNPHAATVTFPDAAPTEAVLELTVSGHGPDEFWYDDGRVREFTLLVDGTEVARVVPVHYFYAFLGIYGEGYGLHPLTYWTAQQALDVAGIHTGVGELPPYRAHLTGDALALLTGEREVTVVATGGECNWPTSVAFLLD